MRKLMWFAIGFGAACVIGIYWLPVAALFALAGVFAGIGILLLCKKDRQWPKLMAMICIGSVVGFLWFGIYDSVWLRPVRALDGQVVELTLTADDYSFDTDYGICVDGTAQLAGQSCTVRMYVDQTEPLKPGDTVKGNFRLRYTAPGAIEDVTYHSGKGILLLAYPKGDHSVTVQEGKELRYTAAYLRRDILELMDDIFPEDAAPFTKALLLGDTTQLDYKTESDLSVSGLRHVAAVSGLHVSILFSVIYLFAGRRRILSAVLGIPLLVLFAAMAGFSPSILRASIMQALMLLAMAVKKEYDPPTALAFSALVMLAVNPLTVTSVGFQLSVSSVAGIFLFSGRMRNWLLNKVHFKKKGLPASIFSKAITSVSISVGALITTTPLTAWYFGSVNLLSAVTNLLCLWVVTILFCGIIFACLLGAVWSAAGQLVGWLLAWLVRYVLGVAGLVAGIPLAAVYTQSLYIVIWLVVSYILLAVLLWKKKRPLLLGSCCVLLLCVALLLSWVLPQADSYRVTVLDVGQGQCVLLQSQGRTYMVDCGGSHDGSTADLAAETLLSQGIQRLDGLILTHYDKDHVGAAQYLLQRIPADLLILPGDKYADVWDEQILPHHSGNTLRADKNMQIKWADAVITVYASYYQETSNESSLCVLFHTEKCDILITGDRSIAGEEILLETENIPPLDALVAGHHGSGKSTGTSLLEAAKPKIALISVGEGNAYGHPEQEVLERLQAYGCVIRRTDLEGTIIIRG